MHYSYDAAGNRTNLRRSWDLYPENYSIIANRNQLESRKHHDAEIGDTILLYQYNRNGSLIRRRMQQDSSTGAWTNWPGWPKPSGIGQQFNEELRYSYRNLLNRVYHSDSARNGYDWRYRYSPSGEREQKRLMRFIPWIPPIVTHPIDTPRIAHGWVYYLLGGNNQQLAVYHGQQDTGNVCNDTSAGVSMYPTEYLTYGAGRVPSISTDPTGAKSYTISDHLGSIRVSVGSQGGTSQSDYEPFGTLLNTSSSQRSRLGFIGQEVDRETGSGLYGVRLYEFGRGGFGGVDPKCEQYAALTPYHYSGNNAMRFIDPTGMEIDVSDLQQKGYTQSIMSDLSQITGLSFYVQKGKLKYRKDAKGNAVVAKGRHSSIARDFFISAINNKKTVTAIEGVSGSRNQPGSHGKVIEIDPMEIAGMIKGTSPGLNPLTESWGMNVTHELLHSVVGPNGGLYDDLQTTGGVVDLQNAIRRQLGEDWGQRMRYSGTNIQNGICLPFDQTALEFLQQQKRAPLNEMKLPPSGKYIFLK